MKTAEETYKEHKAFLKRNNAIYKKNQKLIKEWDTIPWWQE